MFSNRPRTTIQVNKITSAKPSIFVVKTLSLFDFLINFQLKIAKTLSRPCGLTNVQPRAVYYQVMRGWTPLTYIEATLFTARRTVIDIKIIFRFATIN